MIATPSRRSEIGLGADLLLWAQREETEYAPTDGCRCRGDRVRPYRADGPLWSFQDLSGSFWSFPLLQVCGPLINYGHLWTFEDL
jgi:hypothetical protein